MSYNGLAFFYKFLERIAFGSVLLQSKKAFLDRIQESQNVLIVGGGNLEFLRDYKSNNVTFTCIDSSSKMLELASKNSKHLKHKLICQ